MANYNTTYSLEDITSAVRLVLSENESIDTILTVELDSITPENEDVVEKMILPAIDKVHGIAPQAMIANAAISLDDLALSDLDEADISTTDDYCNKLLLPKNFLRLSYCKLPEWRVPVYSLTDSSTEEYQQAQSPYSYMRPKERCPMVSLVISRNQESSLWFPYVLETYPRTSDPGDVDCTIVLKAEVSSSSVIISNACYDAVIYMIASLYYTSINEKERATMMQKRCYELLNLTTDNGSDN